MKKLVKNALLFCLMVGVAGQQLQAATYNTVRYNHTQESSYFTTSNILVGILLAINIGLAVRLYILEYRIDNLDVNSNNLLCDIAEDTSNTNNQLQNFINKDFPEKIREVKENTEAIRNIVNGIYNDQIPSLNSIITSCYKKHESALESLARSNKVHEDRISALKKCINENCTQIAQKTDVISNDVKNLKKTVDTISEQGNGLSTQINNLSDNMNNGFKNMEKMLITSHSANNHNNQKGEFHIAEEAARLLCRNPVKRFSSRIVLEN